MKNTILFAFLFVFITMSAQQKFIHCGKIVDTKNGKVLSNKTIVVAEKK